MARILESDDMQSMAINTLSLDGLAELQAGAAKELADSTGGDTSELAQIMHPDFSDLASTTENSVVSYNDGYGDFSFGRLIDRRRFHKALTIKDIDDEDALLFWAEEKEAAFFKEMGEFTRSEAFPFFEFRLRLDYDHTKDRDFIKIELYGTLSKHLQLIGEGPRDFDKFFKQYQCFWDVKDRYEMPTGEDYTLLKMAYERQEEISRRQQTPHPHRALGYTIQTGLVLRDGQYDCLRDNNDWFFLEWFRQCSNVSKDFREELGSAFWSVVHIITDCPYFIKFGYVASFMSERPATLKGIKSLCFTLNFENGVDLQDFDGFCEGVGRLGLECLQITIDIREDELDYMAQGVDEYAELLAIRSLKVYESFDIKLSVFSSMENMELQSFGVDVNVEETYKLLKTLEKKYEPIMRELLLPDTLRPVSTEVTDYIRSRLES